MDLLDKSATALEFVMEGDLSTSVASSSPRVVTNGEIEANGSCLDAIPGSETGGNFGGITPLGSKQVGGSSNSSPGLSKSPSVGSSSPAIKGYGLKKWRRIRRDVVKDSGGVADTSKAMKRGLSGAGASVKPVNRGSVENRRASEEIVGSASVLSSPGFDYENGIPGSSSNSRFAVGYAFGAESENSVSEDRSSSKSSTAASAPRASGYGMDKHRVKSLPAKVAVNSVQRGQQVESSKKARGEKAKIEKQNSHSSLESDSRSSNFVFSQGLYSATSNGKQSEMSMNDDRENSEELQTRYDHVTVEEDGDDSAVDASSQNKEEKNESRSSHSSSEKDPFVESLIMLQSVQEALQNEIKKFGEIENISFPPSTDTGVASGKAEQSSTPSQDSKHLETRLKEMLTLVCSKEAKVAELEDKLQRDKSDSRELEADFKIRSEEMEIELESLFKQKIDAEVQYLALRKTLQESKANKANPQPLRAEIEALIGEQEQMRQKVRAVESKAKALKKGAEDVVKAIDAEEEGSSIRKGICKTATCFSIQLMLLMLVLWLLVLQMSLDSGVVVVPT
ncbi:WPP domain-interacting protein 1 [Linum perenne]